MAPRKVMKVMKRVGKPMKKVSKLMKQVGKPMKKVKKVTKSMKRAAATAAAVPSLPAAAKRRRKDAMSPAAARASELAAPWAPIVVAVRAAPDEVLPSEVRSMLANVLGKCLTVPKDQRHAVQEAVVETVGETLMGIMRSLEKAVADAQSKVDGSDADKANREAARAELEPRVEALREAVVEAKARLASDTEAAKNADAALIQVKEDQKTGDAASQEAVEKKEMLQAAQTDTYLPLQESGAADDAEGRRQLKLVASIGMDFNFDASLMVALPMALKKAPAQRGEFDLMMIKQFADELTRQIGEQEAIIKSAEPAKAEREVAVATAQASVDSAKSTQEESASALLVAQEECRGAEAELQAALVLLRDFLPQLQVVMDGLDDAKAELARFREGPLAIFEPMRDATTPPPAEAVHADAPAAEAVVAAESAEAIPQTSGVDTAIAAEATE